MAALPASAQPGFFTFTYPGPVNIAVDSNCSASVSGNIGTPVVTSTIGATITTSAFDPAASGYSFTDQWSAPLNNLIVVWMVADNMGHSANFSFTVNMLDLSPPVFILTGIPSTLNLNSIVQVLPPPVIPITENCTPIPQVIRTFIETTPPDTCQSGTFTRTWRATDLSGNTATFTQTINVFKDTLPPTVSVFPQNGSAPCAQLATAYPAWLATQMANFTASDPSGIKELINNAPATFPPGCAVPLTVTFWAVDNCDLLFPTTAIFSTSDNTPPVVNVAPKDTVAYCSPGGNQMTALGKWINKRGYLQAGDACTPPNLLVYKMRIGGIPKDSAQVVSALLASYSNGCGQQMVGNQLYAKVKGKVTVTFYVEDACGNSTLAGSATFGVIDSLPPVIGGVNVSEQCGNGDDMAMLSSWINAHGNTTVTDDCSTTSWMNFSWATSGGQTGMGVFNVGPYPSPQLHNCTWFVDVTFRAIDECSNVGSKTLRFQILDTQKPVIAGFPATVTLPCPNPVPTLSAAFVSDNCDTSMVISYTSVNSNFLCDGSYTMLVTWKATDDCGNTGTANQTVLVRDTIGPVFTLAPGPQTFRCDTFVLPPDPVMGVNITATDNCSPVSSITTQTNSGQNPNPALCGHYTYTITRVFTATDQCGNTRTATQLISVIDNLAPVVSVSDTTVVCDLPPMTLPATAADACSGPTQAPVAINQFFTPGACADEGILTLLWQASDVCGNTGTATQQIFIIDTVAPVLSGIPADITVECDAIPVPPATSSFGSSDNCASSVGITLSQSEIRNPDENDCAHWTNYLIKREWTAADNCGNLRKYTQNISVQDNTGPVMVPPQPVMLPADAGVCGADVWIPAPVSLYDQCTSQGSMVVMKDTALLITTTGGPPLTTPVDTLVFNWSPPNLPPGMPVVGTASLSLFLDKVDSNDPNEYFNLYSENAGFLGKTDLFMTSCAVGTKIFTLQADSMNKWMADGDLIFRLAPNGSGGAAPNPVCPGGRVIATITYQFKTQELPLTLTYTLDNSPPSNYPPGSTSFLETGLHTVVYTATDCAGNSSTASVTVSIQDLQPPILTPPAPITAYVGQNNCLATVALPFPGIFENCDVTGSLVQASAQIPMSFYLSDAGYIPADAFMTINGLVPNAISNGKLKIRHRGDNFDSGEFFKIYDENNVQIPGTTDNGTFPDECLNYNETIFNVSAANINNWAANGAATFKAIANDDVLNYIDFINPCGPLNPSLMDSASRIQALLEYSFAVVTYQITKSGSPPLIGTLVGSQTGVNLSPGIYTVKYIVADVNGLEGMTSYTLTVLDTVKPKAMCKQISIQTNPSGLIGDIYLLQPAQINNGSTDNCTGPLTYQLSQQSFPCSLATPPPNNVYTVVLTVTDSHGNSSTCSATVTVLPQSFNPYSDPVCEGGKLKLYANEPGAYGTSVYTFQWSNQLLGNFSPLQNPEIPNAQLINEGTYTVTVTGLTGCTAVGTTVVDLVNLPFAPVLMVNAPPVCFGDSIHLSTLTYNGQNVRYRWYAGTQGNSILLDSTLSPQYIIPQPLPGNYQYYVVVAADGCTSVNSQTVNVTVFARPVAVINQGSSISVCEGQTILLNTPSQPGFSYAWSGPQGFNYTVASPPAIVNAQQIHDGIYMLVVTENGCASLPASIDVNVLVKPPKPQINNNTGIQVCVGTSVPLVCNIQGATQYFFEKLFPNVTINNGNVSTLVLPTVALADNGSWRVRVLAGGCLSDWSDWYKVEVQAYPNVSAMPVVNVCEYDTLKLTANANLPISTWLWSGPGSFVAFNQQFNRFPALAGSYSVIGKTSFGCADTAIVQVNVIPRPVISSISNNAPVCANGVTGATLMAVIQTPFGPVTYNWTWSGSAMNPFFTDSMPMIPIISPANNGTYTLIVKDIYGCASNPVTTTISTNAALPTPLLSMSDADGAICQGDSVTFTVSNANAYPPSPTTKYHWKRGASLLAVTMTPSYVLVNAQVLQSGTYTVQVLTDSCSSPVSAAAILVVHPIPAIPVPDSNAPLCEGETLYFSVTNPVSGGLYMWSTTATNPFTPMEQSPSISNVTTGNEGLYFVKVTVNGCTAGPGEPIFVDVKKLPKKPSILLPPSSRLCDLPGTMINLQIDVNTTTQMAEYTWILEPNNDTIAGPSPSSALSIPVDQFNPGPLVFKVIAHKAGCDSPFSETVTIYLDTIPEGNVNAGEDRVACISTPLKLDASAVSGATGKWTQIGVPVVNISPLNDPKAEVNGPGLSAGNMYQFVWTLSNGGCKNYASDTVKITMVAPEPAIVVDTLMIECAVSSLEISAIQGVASPGSWSQSSTQANQLNIGITDPSAPTTTVTNLTPGAIYYFYWTLADIGCGPSTARVEVRNYFGKPNTGPDKTVCSQEPCANLMAFNFQPSFEVGEWSSSDPTLIFDYPNNPTTGVCNLKPGPNVIYWTTNNEFCGLNSNDTLLVNYELSPTTLADLVTVDYGAQVQFNILTNDILPQNFSVTLNSLPLHGSLDSVNTGIYQYQPDAGFTGSDMLIYMVCNLFCPTACSATTVTFTVAAAADCSIPTLITPNNDRVNDAFVIPGTCLGEGGSIEVTIFNQWGDAVFNANPYLNDWEGTYNGEQLPTGTYYYVVKFGNQAKPQTGFLIIQR